MIIMVTIGVGIFVGANIEWFSLKKDTDSFLQETNYADYRIYNEQGFSSSDIEKVKNIDGVDVASRVLSVNVDIKNTEKSLGLFCLENYSVSTFKLMSGADYDENSDGFWLSDKFAEANGLSIGDTLTVTYRNFEISGQIAGLVKSGEFMICTADENQLMPDFNSYGFAYASPKKIMAAIGFDFYPQINITSSLEKAQIEDAINAALGKTTLLLGKEEHTAYAAAKSEIEEGKTMSELLPILFLAIGILTMITTMHRITANEKTQIGTLKALGFKNKKILAHYTSYGFVVGLIGCLLGVLLGFGIGLYIINPTGAEGTYFDMSVWKLYMPWFCYPVLILTVAFLTLISFLSVKKMLNGTAADALRPYVPKKMKPLALEKTRVWKKMSFATRWNLRDVCRHKARSIMTFIGVLGCMILLVAGLGMKDTMKAYLDVIDTKIFNYQTRVNMVDGADNTQVENFAESVDGDWVSTQSVKLGEDVVSLEIYDIKNDKFRFIDESNKIVQIGNDGVYICARVRDSGVKVGDTISFSPYGSDETYSVKVAGVLRSVMTENVVMTRDYAEKLGITYTISAVFTDVAQSDIAASSIISGTQTKQSLMASYDGFMLIMNAMILVLVVGAVILGIVVLYNLGVMSYVERYRELATLKVVGFKSKKISRILISQNIWLTVIGIVVGLPLGAGVLFVLLKELANEYELKMVIGFLTYFLSVLITLGTSIVVGLLLSRRNKKIDMVEALKGAE